MESQTGAKKSELVHEEVAEEEGFEPPNEFPR